MLGMEAVGLEGGAAEEYEVDMEGEEGGTEAITEDPDIEPLTAVTEDTERAPLRCEG